MSLCMSITDFTKHIYKWINIYITRYQITKLTHKEDSNLRQIAKNMYLNVKILLFFPERKHDNELD